MRTPWDPMLLAFGNGDGRLLYPPKSGADGRPDEPVIAGPVDSIRFEMLRDGIEDYEYLAILERLLEEHGEKLDPEQRPRYETMLEAPAEITASMTEFTVDPAPIEVRRHRIARAIESFNALADRAGHRVPSSNGNGDS